MSRKLDDLGRIVIPAELREKLNMQTGNEVDITEQDNSIIIKKQAFGCTFCGAVADLVQYMNKDVCRECIDALNKLKAK